MKRAAVPSILVAVVLLALGVMAEAQRPKKVHRIGFLAAPSPSFFSTPFSLFLRTNRTSFMAYGKRHSHLLTGLGVDTLGTASSERCVGEVD
jgi:hypothetical protein